MKIVEYLESDYEAMKKLWLDSFKEDTVSFFKTYMETTHKKGKTLFLKDGKEILSMLTYINKEIALDGNKYHAILIEGVATPKEHMRKGYMNQLMEHILATEKSLRELVIIQAYNTEVYKKYGFVETHNLKHASIVLKKTHEYKNNHEVEPAKLKDIFDKYVSTKDGFHARTTDDFHDLAKQIEAMKGHIFFNNHAYMIVVEHIIQEIAYTDIKHLNKLISCLEGEFKIQLAEDELGLEDRITDVNIRNNTMLLVFNKEIAIDKKLYFPEFV